MLLDRMDGRPKLIGQADEKDNKRATDHVAVCHMVFYGFIGYFGGRCDHA
jgi:hypothetical protein